MILDIGRGCRNGELEISWMVRVDSGMKFLATVTFLALIVAGAQQGGQSGPVSLLKTNCTSQVSWQVLCDASGRARVKTFLPCRVLFPPASAGRENLAEA